MISDLRSQMCRTISAQISDLCGDRPTASFSTLVRPVELCRLSLSRLSSVSAAGTCVLAVCPASEAKLLPGGRRRRRPPGTLSQSGMCDADGDGQVTFDEFYKLMAEPHKEHNAPREVPRALPPMPAMVLRWFSALQVS